ncbi:MAG: hypothetical protein AAF939_17415 [Planctomycetota bacterium]
MGNILREIIGWILTVGGLVLIGLVVLLALQRNVFEAMALAIPSTVVFRSGIGLVRMSAAARIAAGLSNSGRIAGNQSD